MKHDAMDEPMSAQSDSYLRACIKYWKDNKTSGYKTLITQAKEELKKRKK